MHKEEDEKPQWNCSVQMREKDSAENNFFFQQCVLIYI